MRDYSAVFSSESYGETGVIVRTSVAGYVGDRSSSVYSGEGGSAVLQYRVSSSSRPEIYGIVTQALAQTKEGWYKQHSPDAHQVMGCSIYDAQWVEMPTGLGLGTTWNLLWTWSKPRINFNSLLVWQKVNHFPRSRELTRKDLLKRNIGRMEKLCAGSKQHQQAFQIMPRTFVLPHEYNKFVNTFYEEERQREPSHLNESAAKESCSGSARNSRRSLSPNIWILKPVGLSRGRGITLVSDIGEVKYDSQCVVQQYLQNPLLIDGYKWDLRLYVLVTSFQPIEAFLYREGSFASQQRL